MAHTFNLFSDIREEVVRPIDYNSEKQAYIESVLEDHNLLNFINVDDDCNLNTASNISEDLLSTEYENVSQVVSIECLNTLTSDTNFEEVAINSGYEEFNVKKNVEKCQKFVHLQDSIVPPRAVAVLPKALYYKCDSVVPRRSLPTKVKFGPVTGVDHQISIEESQQMVLEAARSKVPIFLKKVNGNIVFIDVSDRDKSNWFGLLPFGDQNTANVWLHQEGDELYGVAVRSIAPRTPLLLGYSKQYADDHNIPAGLPILDIAEDLSEDIQRQSYEQVHREKKIRLAPRRGRLQCRYCSQKFCRPFTLKRHMVLYCTKKTGKNVSSKPDPLPEIIPTTTLNIEDGRLPSDESLQNYSNGLDFSTSLFDTDRISNLDISGGSKSEMEFNPYSLSYRDESASAVDVGSTSIEPEVQHSSNKDQNQSVPMEPFLITCELCNETIVRESKSQHLQQCRKRHLKCECGRVFKDRARLAKHIHTQHRNPVLKDKGVDNQQIYQCEKCEHKYMRRGMLVIHMWQVHRSRATLPLQRRVRHYPCVACPKLYRAAGKRDRHVRRHHPGVELVKGGSIDGGVRSCEPAACPECPRQYVTRAKMLQHMRAAHPHLAPPKQKSIKTR